MLETAKVNIGESTTEESYERMPIYDFGRNVLQKLGWKEEKPIGKSLKDGEVYSPPKFDKLIPRQSRLGLGAKPLNHDQIKKMNKNGDHTHKIINDCFF